MNSVNGLATPVPAVEASGPYDRVVVPSQRVNLDVPVAFRQEICLGGSESGHVGRECSRGAHPSLPCRRGGRMSSLYRLPVGATAISKSTSKDG